ncbi:hypothetical protein ACH4FX_12330 [Streptomyces sp. NPDC018019]|uniref:hypothetical protein n=1 Tax=Streptomyces sp. NPDC018019 TaxID=3365030 RepID=UPI0037A66A25
MNDAEAIAESAAQLATGCEERVQFTVIVRQHAPQCRLQRAAMTPGRRKHHECDCPGHLEERAETKRFPALIQQLEAAVFEPASAAGDSGGGADKPHSNPPGNQAVLDLLFAVKARTFGYYHQLRNALFPDYRDAPATSTANALAQIADWAAMACDGTLECSEELVHDIRTGLGRLVRGARITLGHDAPQRMLADTVCGECGGALVVADDASSDVRCIGTPEAPPCGTKYFRWQWVDLLEGEGA